MQELVNWTVRSSQFDTSGAVLPSTVGILILLYGDNINHWSRLFKFVLQFMDISHTLETQISQGEMLLSLNSTNATARLDAENAARRSMAG